MENEEPEQKPQVGGETPTKSSMEILSELFNSFDAEPPVIVKKEKGESPKKPKKSKKKHKHKDKKHKKKDKKRKRDDSSSSDGSEIDLAKILIKQEKESSEQRIKIEGTDLTFNLDAIKKEKEDVVKQEKEAEPVNRVKDDIEKETVEDGELSSHSDHSTDEKKKRKHKHSKSEHEKSSKKKKKEEKSPVEDLRNKINNSKHSSNHHYKAHKRSRSRSRSKSKERHKKDDDDFYRPRSEIRRSDSHHRYRSRDRDKYKEYDYKSKRTEGNPFYKEKDEDCFWGRDRYRSSYNRNRRRRSTSRDSNSAHIDKKKLLEIARKNAIQMMKSGSLPGALTLGPQAQEKVIAAIRAGGKTIEELTDFCKTLSKKEELGELSSNSDGSDGSDTDRPFHHPFQIKDRPTSITINIKNSVPLPIKSSVERTSELRLQFPVSSGQLHRKTESEWVPVEKKKAPEPVPPPTPKPIAPSAAAATSAAAVAASVEALKNADADKQQAIAATVDENGVDIGSIVSQRLTAIRKLQENPNDVQALTQMYKVNKEMQSWAESKQQPGQFTGTTGVQVLSAAELSSGYQAWAKKDQLTTATPVSGGMGMHLLQKMGWKPGEGLGKEKSGALEPLLLEVKLDKKGLVANEEQKRKKKQGQSQWNTYTIQNKHPVSLLGEYASKKKLGAPQYELCFECGPDHKKNFLFKVILNGVEYKPNVASPNKKEAKAAAASVCLQHMGLLNQPPAIAP